MSCKKTLLKPRPLRIIAICLLLATYFYSSGQDLHSSNYNYNLTFINPAETGAFLGNVRIQGSYRDQNDAFFVKGYNSQIASVDMPLNIKFLKRGWTGYGLGLFNDKSGDLGLRNTGIMASFSYHLPFDKKYRQVISVGFQVQNISRSIGNPGEAKFSDSFSGAGGGDIQLLDNFASNTTDYNFGILYKYVLNKKSRISFGASIAHPFKSANNNINSLFKRINIYSRVDFRMSNRIIIKPVIYTSFSQSNFNIAPQCIVEYFVSGDLKIGTGLGYRVADALQAIFTANYKGWDIGLAYDVTISSARTYNSTRGGFEIGLKRIFIIPKTPKVDRVSICPTI